LGWQGVKAMIDAMTQADYQHCKSIRLWRAKAQDEGARVIAAYVRRFKNCTVLELLDCEISPLGCEFLNDAFMMGQNGGNLQIIKLDHNPLGDDGANILAQSLGSNSQIQVLSLTYC